MRTRHCAARWPSSGRRWRRCARLGEPEEIIRAIRQGEIDALVIEQQGREAVYALQAFDSVYRSMVEECFPYGVWLADTDGKLIYVSPSFLDLIGVDLATIRDRGQFHFLEADARAAADRDWARSRATGEPFEAEHVVRFPDGTERTIWTRGVLAGPSQGLPHWVGVNIDVTEARKIKEELKEQAETLQRQAKALMLADRRKDEFLALLGHELRNPLAPIRNALHILMMPGVDEETAAQVKAIMEKQVNHLTRIVDDLLDVGRITRGRITLRKERADLSRAVANAVESVRPLMTAQGQLR